MTITNLVTRNDYVASAGQTIFSYTFKLLSNAHVKVYVNGVLKTLTTDYSVGGVGNDAGGNITFVSGLTLNDVVALVRLVPLTQESDYVTNDIMSSDMLENNFDKLTMAQQELQRDQSDRVLKLPLSSGLTNIEFPASANRAGTVPRWKSDGSGLEEVAVATGAVVSVITAKGDLVQGSPTGTAEKLAIGRAAQRLRVVSGAASWNHERETVVKSSNATLTFADAGKLVMCDASSGNITITLPSPSLADNGAVFTLVKIDTTYRTVTVKNALNETIDGAASVVLRKPYDYVTIVDYDNVSYVTAQNFFRRTKHTGGCVTNGGFDDINQSVSQLGTNDSAWLTGQSWTIANGLATMNGGLDSTIQQTDVMTVSRTYRIIYTVSGRTAGTITVKAGSTAGTTRSTNGTFQEDLAAATDGNLTFQGKSGFDGSIDNVSVQLISTVMTIPVDDTKPQNNEGDKCLQLKHIPSNANNIIHIRGAVYVSAAAPGGSDSESVAALFVDSGADAVAGGMVKIAANSIACIPISYKMKAGGTSEKKFHVRVGTGSGAVTIDGYGGERRYGGIILSFLELTEEYV